MPAFFPERIIIPMESYVYLPFYFGICMFFFPDIWNISHLECHEGIPGKGSLEVSSKNQILQIDERLAGAVSTPALLEKQCIDIDSHELGRPKKRTYPSASSISKPLKLSLLLCKGLPNDTPLERNSSNNLSGSAVATYASHAAHS
jgi:hypothetical protein